MSKYNQVKAVCANLPAHKNGFSTIREQVDAMNQGMEILHCGECGRCSNHNDIQVMKNTHKTLTKTVTGCAIQGLLLGDKAAEKCLEKKVGFTPACSSCWSDNIRCTRKKCRFTCIKSLISKEPNNHDGMDLNPCLECDERLCGPTFIECAGANRRRLGIESDIKRNKEQELCHHTAHKK